MWTGVHMRYCTGQLSTCQEVRAVNEESHYCPWPSGLPELFWSHKRPERRDAELLAATATSPALERLESVLAKGVALLEEQGALLGPVAGPDMREVPCDEADFSRRFSFQFSPWYLWLHELLAGLLTEAVERGE